jgi:hypothetical protein
MENAMMSSPWEERVDARKVPIMKTLARFHECDVETLYGRVDASELDVHDILREMISRNEVEASQGGVRNERFTLTLKGWDEYMKVLGSIYELSE